MTKKDHIWPRIAAYVCVFLGGVGTLLVPSLSITSVALWWQVSAIPLLIIVGSSAVIVGILVERTRRLQRPGLFALGAGVFAYALAISMFAFIRGVMAISISLGFIFLCLDQYLLYKQLVKVTQEKSELEKNVDMLRSIVMKFEGDNNNGGKG